MDYFNTHYVKCDGRVTWKELYVEMLERCHKLRAEEMDRLVQWWRNAKHDDSAMSHGDVMKLYFPSRNFFFPSQARCFL